MTQAGTDPRENTNSNSNLYRNLLIGLVALIVAGLVITLVVVITSGDDYRVGVGANRADLHSDR